MPHSPTTELLTRWVSRIIDQKSLERKLELGTPLRIKFGIDPTGTIVHLGHMVPILKLRAFQELGHTVILLIGDSTAQVGDTSDKEWERPMLTRAQTRENAANWLGLFGKVLDLSKTEVRYNSEWMDTINFNAVGELASNFSVAEMLDRDNFSKRYKAGVRISLQEFLYPIMQGYDSVALNADVELGGNDQYFNLLAGRTLQEAHGQAKQDVMTFDLLLGPDGKKMSKTGGNTIAVNMTPQEMFVKTMEVSDDLIVSYFELATTVSLGEITAIKERLIGWEHPRTLKLELAHAIVSLYHSEVLALEARSYFDRVIALGGRPADEEIPHFTASTATLSLASLLKELGYFVISGDIRNAISGGGVGVDGVTATDAQTQITLSPTQGLLINAGKKRYTLVFAPQDVR